MIPCLVFDRMFLQYKADDFNPYTIENFHNRPTFAGINIEDIYFANNYNSFVIFTEPPFI